MGQPAIEVVYHKEVFSPGTRITVDERGMVVIEDPAGNVTYRHITSIEEIRNVQEIHPVATQEQTT